MKKILFGLVAAVALAIAMPLGAMEVKQGYVADKAPAAEQVARADCDARDAGTANAYKVSTVDLEVVKEKLAAGDLFGAVVALLFGAGGVSLAMTTLAADKARDWELGDYNDTPVIASDVIYEGAAVSDNGTNAAEPLVAGHRFIGFAETTVDNSTGATGAKNVRLRTKGRVKLPITSIDQVDVGKAVFASDDDTFTLTDNGTNSHIGKAVRFVGTGTVIVEFDANKPAMGPITALTDSSGGTVLDQVGTISATYVAAEIKNALATLTDRINDIRRQMVG